MKTLGKYAVAFGFALLMGSWVYAQDSSDDRIETTIMQIQGRIVQLEHQLIDLKAVNTKSLGKAERKHLKLQKRALKQALASERNVLNRLTQPEPVWYGPYGPAYYTAFGPWGYYNPYTPGYPNRYYHVKRVYVAPNHPAPPPPKNVIPDRTPRRPDGQPAARRTR